MRERTNRTVSKTVVSQGTVGSNPTPSASSEVVFRLRPSRPNRGLSLKNPSHLIQRTSFSGYAFAMAGTMREGQSGVWEPRVRVGRDPPTGKHRQISRTFKGTERQASKALAKLMTNAPEGSHAGGNKTVKELLGRRIDHLEARGRTPKTIDDSRSITRARLEPALGRVTLRQLTPVHLDDLYLSLLGAGLSPVYVCHCHAALSTVLRQAVKWDRIDRSPADRATRPGGMPPEVGPPDADDISRLIATEDKVGPDMASMLFVAATTACRRGELCGLRWPDLDIANSTVTVRRSILRPCPSSSPTERESGGEPRMQGRSPRARQGAGR